jgi:NifU-like domain
VAALLCPTHVVLRHEGNAEAAPAVSMNVETVDRALEEVRPYLIADGGNVTVLDVVDGTVMLQLDVSAVPDGKRTAQYLPVEG